MDNLLARFTIFYFPIAASCSYPRFKGAEGASQVPQITGRMTISERARFGDYSRSLGLDGGSVATLLIARELRQRRLPDLALDAKLRPTENSSGTITTHRLPEGGKRGFYQHVKAAGLSASKALGLLCRSELQERWLERSINFDSDRIEN